MKNLESQLKTLGHLLNQEKPITDLNEEDILAYAENQLSEGETEHIEQLILQKPELIDEITRLRALIRSKPAVEPPFELSSSLLKTLHLQQPVLMDLIIRSSGRIMEIVKGQEWLLPTSNLYQMSTRGQDVRLQVFRSQIPPYDVYCNVQHETVGQSVFFTFLDNHGGKIKNGRFYLRRDNEKIFEALTDSTGCTPVRFLDPGRYDVTVSLGRIDIGIIKMDFS